ncbi:MAG: hypothetical protein QW478_15865 [Candidatus Micrarchaeaceae archaeon]
MIIDKYGYEYVQKNANEVLREIRSRNVDLRKIKSDLQQIWIVAKEMYILQQHEALRKDAAHKAVLDRKQANR